VAAASIDELEASLQTRWDLETLEVYADCLESRGDPRGELIALDLAIAKQGATPELLEIRRARLIAWLGSDTICSRPWNPRDFRFGFLEDYFITGRHVEQEYVAALLASPAGGYLRGVHLFTDAGDLAEALELLASRPLRWLRRLAIRQVDDKGPVPAKVIDAFIAAAPHLEELALDGERILLSPCHPNVRTLRLTGGTAIVVGAAAMPQVTELDLVLDHADATDLPRLAALANPRTFPGLQRLDLSRNEYSYPTTLDRNVGVFPFLHAVERLERITHLRLPSLRTEQDVRDLHGLLARLPDLTIEIARMYVRPVPLLDGFEHPRVHVPAPRPWPPRDELSSREALTITLPGDEYGDQLALTSCMEELEVVLDTLAPVPRTAWIEVWRFLDGLGWETADGDAIVLPFPAATLALALEVLDDPRCQRIAHALREARLPPGATVRIKRYWGW